MSQVSFESLILRRFLNHNNLRLGQRDMGPLKISCKGGKSSCKWKSAKEGVKMSCYAEELPLFNPMMDIDLIFTSSDFPEIPVKLLRLKVACGCIPVCRLILLNPEVVRGGWRKWIKAGS